MSVVTALGFELPALLEFVPVALPPETFASGAFVPEVAVLGVFGFGVAVFGVGVVAAVLVSGVLVSGVLVSGVF